MNQFKEQPLKVWAYNNMTEALKNTIKSELQWSDYNLTAKINLSRPWTFDEIRLFEKAIQAEPGTILAKIPEWRISVPG